MSQFTFRYRTTRSKAASGPPPDRLDDAPRSRDDLREYRGGSRPPAEAAGAAAEAILAERRGLARELHDGPVQSLWFLGTEIRRLQEQAAAAAQTPPEVSAGLQALQATWARVYDELRQVIGDLHQPLPADHTLLRMLERSLASLERQTGVATELCTEIDAERYPLDPATEAQLVRIGQAALANVRRHATARLVRVDLRVDAEGVLLSIEDDGVGFEPLQVSQRPTAHYGLTMMRERVETLGGRLELLSALGEGTRLRVWVPLHRQ